MLSGFNRALTTYIDTFEIRNSYVIGGLALIQYMHKAKKIGHDYTMEPNYSWVENRDHAKIIQGKIDTLKS